MIFSEVYSCYYNTVSEMISKALRKELDTKSMHTIIRNNAFSESNVDIPRAVTSGRWHLIKKDFSTVIRHNPDRPLTILEKQWLKSLLSDPRIRLFDINPAGLEEVTPLYDNDVFVRFDIHGDGDPFENPVYIQNFRTLLQAIKEKRMVKVNYTDRRGFMHELECDPDNMEYSFKNDKFRIVVFCKHGTTVINLSQINQCILLDTPSGTCGFVPNRIKKELTAELTDRNNALDRAMICFSYLEKETTQLDNNRYIFKLKYFEEDEAEIITQILSFGTNFRVTAPDEIISKIRNKLFNQKKLNPRFDTHSGS